MITPTIGRYVFKAARCALYEKSYVSALMPQKKTVNHINNHSSTPSLADGTGVAHVNKLRSTAAAGTLIGVSTLEIGTSRKHNQAAIARLGVRKPTANGQLRKTHSIIIVKKRRRKAYA